VKRRRQRAAQERWRAEALASLNDWHALEASVPPWFTDGRLGQAWPKIVAAYIAHLEAEVRRRSAPAKLNRR